MNALITAGNFCPIPPVKFALITAGSIVTIFGIGAYFDKSVQATISPTKIQIKMD